MNPTLQKHLDYCEGEIAFCRGEPLMLGASEDWLRGWSDIAQKLREEIAKPPSNLGGYRHGVRKKTAGRD